MQDYAARDPAEPSEPLAFERITQQRDEYLRTLQRLQAEFENYRKRVARDDETSQGRATRHLVTTLLPALDTLDLATQHFVDMDTEQVRALHQTRGLLLEALAHEGLERVDASGVPFDTMIHDAITHVLGDGISPPSVDAVLRAGYLWHGVTIRPAMVSVRG
jgi:molecular chaperone GrpE